MIGLGPHTMTTADWVLLAALQIGLIVAAALSVWWAAGRPRPPRRVRAGYRTTSTPTARSLR